MKNTVIIISMTDNKGFHRISNLECPITSDNKINEEIYSLAKTSGGFSRLYKCVWFNTHRKKAPKINMYGAIVLVTFLSVLESWVTYLHRLWLFKQFYQRCLRTILNIHWSDFHWRDFVTNITALEMTKINVITNASMIRNRRCADSYCTVSSPLAIAREKKVAIHECDWKSNTRNRLVPIIWTITDGLPKLRTATM